ncbi:MAG TPA: NYN domain-containing protein [Pirellulaceae bacterium]|nr:NYN domain-containing protein [Pirellulaceae bacterium]HMO92326.1 NYN domain-containing protein [Pirellulaceae bacterium]HMP69250.1 NYN domain-containing protein [Pirellulaceae bacterium]
MEKFTIIDGYNLLREVGFLRASTSTFGPGALARARKALLGFLMRYVPEEVRARATIVFDAKTDVGELPEQEIVHNMHVLFATEYAEADELIEYLINRHSAPKQLVVVSSDHRLKQAAQRRGANSVQSREWFEQVRATGHAARLRTASTLDDSSQQANKGAALETLSPEETATWLGEFNLSQVEIDSIVVNETQRNNPGGVDVSEDSDILANSIPTGRSESLDFGEFATHITEAEIQHLIDEIEKEDPNPNR